MFKIDEYPEIKKAYREHNRLKRIVYSLEKKIRPDDKASGKPYDEAFDKWVAFNRYEFALIIFKTFKEQKPKLYHRFDDCFAKWEEVFPETWEECGEDQRIDLLGLVLELGYGDYWLPDKYYDDKLIAGGIIPPKTHTKPFKCW